MTRLFHSPVRVLLWVASLVTCGAAHATILGELRHPENFNLSLYANWIHYGDNLNARNFDVRLPSGYRAGEAYGLISFCNSSGDGTFGPPEWQPVLDKYRLLWVAGDGIGNAQDTNVRRGAMLLGAMRMTELYAIAPERIYSSGNSGGSRMATGLALMRDDFFTGSIGLVGSAATENLPNDFIRIASRGDESTYQFNAAGDGRTTARFAYQTFYNPLNPDREGDFREQEILTTYHLFMVPNGNVAKLVNSPGDHGSKHGYAFEEAVKFMTHPLYLVMDERFDDGDPGSNSGPGNGFWVASGSASEATVANPTDGSSTVLVLDANASVRSRDVFDWNNDFGMFLDAAYRSRFEGPFNQRIVLGLMAADLREDTRIELILEQRSASDKRASLVLTGMGGPAIVLCSFRLDPTDEPMQRGPSDRAYYQNGSYTALGYQFRGSDLHWAMDDDKFQITFRQNIDRSSLSSALSPSPVLLTDRWTVQGRWSDLGLAETVATLKRIRHWRVELRNEALDDAAAADAAYFDYLEIANSQPGSVAALDGSESTGQLFTQDAAGQGLLVLEAEAFHRQEVQGLHHWVTTTQPAGYAGTGAVTTAKNYQTRYAANEIATWAARLDYPVAFKRKGTHRIWIHGHAAGPDDDACWVGFEADGTDAVQLTGFSQSAYSWASQGIEIDAIGRKTLYLWVGADGLVVDQILISADAAYTPGGAATPTVGTPLPLPGLQTGMTYERWAEGFSIAVGAPEADFDGDGQSNLAEYALNGDPTDSRNPGMPPAFIIEGNKISLSYVIRNDDPALQAVLQASADLSPGSWKGYTPDATSISTIDATFNQVTSEISLSADVRFIRLLISFE